MKLLILKTDIKTKKRVKTVSPVFDRITAIDRWTIDLEDVDKVLRIEAKDFLKEEDIVKLMDSYGVWCEELEG